MAVVRCLPFGAAHQPAAPLPPGPEALRLRVVAASRDEKALWITGGYCGYYPPARPLTLTFPPLFEPVKSHS